MLGNEVRCWAIATSQHPKTIIDPDIGYSIEEFAHYIRSHAVDTLSGGSRTRVSRYVPGAHAEAITRQSLRLWAWLVSRVDVSVGSNREFNHLSLRDAIRLNDRGADVLTDSKSTAHHLPETTEVTSASNGFIPKDHQPNSLDVCVSVSLQRMWESLTGHGPDLKRVPRSEWDLLLGIASTAEAGILQGDLGRLVGQDKRSVPKRTDSLVSKGYIVKHSTLVRGTKTSKLWLKAFAPQISQTKTLDTENVIKMVLSRHILLESLDPVPWHVRWTQDSIDYPALVTTIMALCQEWRVLRLHDLKSKLGILGMRWQMKVVAKLCRFLNARGAIRYVAARLNNKVFKDCIKFRRGLTARDWSMYRATGKRMTQVGTHTAKSGDAAGYDEKQPETLARIQKHSSCATWDVEIPLLVAIERILRSSETSSSGNLDICFLTIGPLFTRFISAVTSMISAPQTQPDHLEHLAVLYEHRRFGKIASFQYSLRYPGPNPITAIDFTWFLLKRPNEGTLNLSGLLTSQNSTLASAIGVDVISARNLTWESPPVPGTEAIEPDITSAKPAPPSILKTGIIAKRKPKQGRPTNKQSRWICEKCGGSWKNGIGLKYHLEKSNTLCNPNARSQSTTKLQGIGIPLMKTPHGNINSESMPRSYVSRGVFQTSWRKSVSRSKSREPRITHVLDICELLTCRTVKSKDEGGLLVENLDKRFVDAIKIKEQTALLEGPETDHMAIQLREPTNDNGALTSLLSPGPTSASQHAEVTPMDYKVPSIVQELVATIIRDLLIQFDEVLPGLTSLAVLIWQRWSSQFPVEKPPGAREIEAAIKRLVRKKLITDHWHGFRNRNGKFEKVQLFTGPGGDLNSPTAIMWIERLKAAHPNALYDFDDSVTSLEMDKDVTSNRRHLGPEVAVLDAPVYIAQLSAKGFRDESERVVKRQKQDHLSDVLDPQVQCFKDLTDQVNVGSSDIEAETVGWSNVQVDIPQHFVDADLRSYMLDDTRPQTSLQALPESNPLCGLLPVQGWCYSPVRHDGGLVLTKRFRTSRRIDQTDHECAFQFFNQCSRREQTDTNTSFAVLAGGPRVFCNFCSGASSVIHEYDQISWETPIETNHTVSECVRYPARSRGEAVVDFIPPLPEKGTIKQEQMPLRSRRLTSMPLAPLQNLEFEDNSKALSSLQHKERMAGFIIVRALLGGVDKVLDWGLLLKIFPTLSLVQLRSFWATVKKENAPLVAKYTEDFQKAYLESVQRNEFPLVDFEHPETYDWSRLVDWTTEILFDETIDLPGTRFALQSSVELYQSPILPDDWRERFFHPQSSIFSRLDSAAADSGALPLVNHVGSPGVSHDISLSRSWMRALCTTSGANYSRQAMKTRLDDIPVAKSSKGTMLNLAIEQLTKEKVICKTKRGTLPTPPYRLNESYVTLLSKLSQRKKFEEAAQFKSVLDKAFRIEGSYLIPYNLTDGAIMALINLQASGKVKLGGENIPFIPLGFEPGNYESRKYSKSSFNFDLRIQPTALYLATDKIGTLKAINIEVVPLQDSLGRLPQWVDLFNTLNNSKWMEILCAVCFTLATRGWMTPNGLFEAMSPVLELFEIPLILAWGQQTGLLVVQDDLNFTVNEWWWLIRT